MRTTGPTPLHFPVAKVYLPGVEPLGSLDSNQGEGPLNRTGWFLGTIVMVVLVGTAAWQSPLINSGQNIPGQSNARTPHNSVPSTIDWNVLLIVIDTLRADHLGCYGAQGIQTPNIDALAREGVLFKNAHTPTPITGPAHACLFTSRYPIQVGVTNNGLRLPSGEWTLAEALRDSGLQTFGAISLGVLRKQFGFNRGFIDYDEDIGEAWILPAPEVTTKAVRWIGDMEHHPFFAFVHYSEPHEPYFSHGTASTLVRFHQNGSIVAYVNISDKVGIEVEFELSPGNNPIRLSCDKPFRLRATRTRPDKSGVRSQPGPGWEKDDFYSLKTQDGTLNLISSNTETIRAKVWFTLSEILEIEEIKRRYRLEVEATDREVGKVLDAIRALHTQRPTLVVLTADHGESLGDHGEIGHIKQLYESMVHIPLIISCPGELPAGLVEEEVVGLVDIFPTITDLVGFEETSEDWEGRSLVPLINGEEQAWNRSLLLETHKPEAPEDLYGVRCGKWKVIEKEGGKLNDRELYDLEMDPGEVTNLWLKKNERMGIIADRMLNSVLYIFTSDETPPDQPPIDEETRARLGAIGYLHTSKE